MHFGGAPNNYLVPDPLPASGHGLRTEDAEFCACRNSAGAVSRGGFPDFRDQTLAGTFPGSGFTTVGEPGTPNASNAFPRSSITRPEIQINGSPSPESGRCTEIECDLFNNTTLGCCVEARLDPLHQFFTGLLPNGNPGTAALPEFASAGDLDTLSGYCSDGCRRSDAINFTERSSLFNTTGAQPPFYCQQLQDGTSGGAPGFSDAL
jgi:hypothetical protein